jgi:hypothetical protein
VKLVNTGGQLLTVTSFSVDGANKADFTATPNCPAPLQPGNSCSISIVFAPSGVGPRQVTLTAVDAAGSQSAQLTGTGVTPQPAVTLTPGSLSFLTTAQGSSSAAQPVNITNSGFADLHISSIAPSGGERR